MWILNFIPDAIITLLIHAMFWLSLCAFIGSFFLRFIPTLGAHAIIIRTISTVFLAISLYLEGGLSSDAAWEAKIADLQKKLEVAEEISKETNTEIQIKYKDRIKVVKEFQVITEEKIKEVEKIVDVACVITPEAISILNESAIGVKGK